MLGLNSMSKIRSQECLSPLQCIVPDDMLSTFKKYFQVVDFVKSFASSPVGQCQPVYLE